MKKSFYLFSSSFWYWVESLSSSAILNYASSIINNLALIQIATLPKNSMESPSILFIVFVLNTIRQKISIKNKATKQRRPKNGFVWSSSKQYLNLSMHVSFRSQQMISVLVHCFIYIYIYIHVCLCGREWGFIHTYIYIYIYIYMHTYIFVWSNNKQYLSLRHSGHSRWYLF